MAYHKKRQIAAESDSEQPIVKKSKSEKKAKKELTQGSDAEGNPYWEIGNNRRISLSQYKGTTFVSIREFYTTPTGELRPGKKGISLPLDQYNALLKVIPELNEKLRAEGHEVGDMPSAGAAESKEVLGNADKPAESKKSRKANIDATSEEESSEDDD